MTAATLKDVLTPCLTDGTAVAGLVVLGWEDAAAYVSAAEALGRPVILQAGPGARRHTPLPVLGAMFRTLASSAKVPVVAHLDHGEDLDVCKQAVAEGFTSVMFDGSALPLDENIAQTRRISEWAHSIGISVEAELGFVGYRDGAASRGTDPSDVARFIAETGVDALAVAVGNVHLMTEVGAMVDRSQLAEIERAAPGLPLVLHGGSGIDRAQRRRIAAETSVCKFNIGTELRVAFGEALRRTLVKDPDVYDRIRILSSIVPDLEIAACEAIESVSSEARSLRNAK